MPSLRGTATNDFYFTGLLSSGNATTEFLPENGDQGRVRESRFSLLLQVNTLHRSRELGFLVIEINEKTLRPRPLVHRVLKVRLENGETQNRLWGVCAHGETQWTLEALQVNERPRRA